MERETLTKVIHTRVSLKTFNRLDSLRAKSNVRSMGEFLRAIVLREKINWYHKNAELESLAVEIGLVRKELNAIGRNINQITRVFHAATQPGQKMVQAIKAESEYKKVELKVNELLTLMNGAITKWWRK